MTRFKGSGISSSCMCLQYHYFLETSVSATAEPALGVALNLSLLELIRPCHWEFL